MISVTVTIKKQCADGCLCSASISRLQDASSTAIQNALSQDVQPPINDWSGDADRLQRIFTGLYINEANPTVQSSASNPPITSFNLSPRSPSVGSSSSTSLKLASVPPLTNKETSAESTRQSVTTTTLQDRGVLVRDSGEDAFRKATLTTNPLYFPCTFNFLNCTDSFADEEQWKTHCLSHFHLKPPPKSVLCPFCHDFEQTFNDPYAAWEARMHHIASHYRAGYALPRSRPDFKLFRHLWQKNIISDADLKELEGNYYLQREPEAYVVTTHQERRNERGTIRLRR